MLGMEAKKKTGGAFCQYFLMNQEQEINNTFTMLNSKICLSFVVFRTTYLFPLNSIFFRTCGEGDEQVIFHV